MHHNPVKRGLVPSPEEWPWCSFRFYYLIIHPSWAWTDWLEFRVIPQTQSFALTRQTASGLRPFGTQRRGGGPIRGGGSFWHVCAPRDPQVADMPRNGMSAPHAGRLSESKGMRASPGMGRAPQSQYFWAIVPVPSQSHQSHTTLFLLHMK
jgi:hypothetical protein